MSDEVEMTPKEKKRKEFLDYVAMLIGKKEDVEMVFPVTTIAEVDMIFDLVHKEIFHNGRHDLQFAWPKGVAAYYIKKVHALAARTHIGKKQGSAIRKRLFKK